MRLVHFLSLTVVMAAGSACTEGASHTHARNEQAPQPYVLEGTEVREIRARALHRDYQLFIGLPRGYAESTRRNTAGAATTRPPRTATRMLCRTC